MNSLGVAMANKVFAAVQYDAYLADRPRNKGYIVHGIKRRSPTSNSGQIDHPFATRTRLNPAKCQVDAEWH
jgi:GDP-D-mannose dehydratase